MTIGRTDVKMNSVYEYLVNAIQIGDIKPGQTLTERGLAAKIAVSRTPVQEAVANHVHKLARLSGNVYLEAIMNMLQTQIGLMMSTSLSSSSRPLQNITEHKMLIDAIRSGGGEFAESIAKHHVRNAREHAMQKLVEGGE